ncbi:MAG: hypothetical protein IKN89_02395 [Oscillospiraceae bacterium]|nr:hypothetical protein [Oscillospiraceae bacterium]
MTEKELAIEAINAEARKRDLSYGQLVARADAEELQRIIRAHKRKKQKK